MDCYIIGKGFSLNYLTPGMIGDGIVITLNQASTKVNSLNLPNTIYCMFKDGPGNKVGTLKTERCDVPCNQCPQGYQVPENAIVLVHKYHSLYCFEDKKRIVFDNTEMELDIFDFSAMSAIKIAQKMKCTKIYLVSFDSVTDKDCRNILGKNNKSYLGQHKRLLKLLDGIDHVWVTPKKGSKV